MDAQFALRYEALLRNTGRKTGQVCPVEKLDERKDQDVVGHGNESHLLSACVIGSERRRDRYV